MSEKPVWAKGLPKFVKVGYLNMTIDLMTTREDREHKRYGWCNTWDESIVISPDLPNRQAAQVFLHELLHAVFHLHYAGSNEFSKEDIDKWVEPFVTGVARGLAGVMVDNPELLPWVQRILRGDTP